MFVPKGFEGKVDDEKREKDVEFVGVEEDKFEVGYFSTFLRFGMRAFENHTLLK